MKKIENVKIAGTMLGIEDHGILTAFLHMEGDGWGCGFGGYALDEWNAKAGKRIGGAAGSTFILRVLETVGADSWEKLKGLHCRVETEGLGGGITKIGHITKNLWYCPKEEFEALRPVSDQSKETRE